MKHGRCFTIVLWVFVTLGPLLGCTQPTPMLRVGTNIWPGYAPLYLAQELGYYQQQKIKIIEFGSATEVLRALDRKSVV